jgi:2-polyprenyl-3-methyl-5-hydroxy-6-metoxy-1,4-benzoquinol methylase
MQYSFQIIRNDETSKIMPDTGIPGDMLRYEDVRSEDDWKRIQSEVFRRNRPEHIDAAALLRRPFNSVKLKIFENYMPKDRICKILEVGCFTAAFGEYFANQGHEVTAVDTPEVLEVTHRDIDVTFIPIDLNDTFPQGQFDIILCTQVIEHIPKDFELLRHIYEHLLPEGLTFVDTTTAMTKPENFYNQAHIRAYPGYSLEALMRTAGFEIVYSARITLKQTGDENVLVIGRKPA